MVDQEPYLAGLGWLGSSPSRYDRFCDVSWHFDFGGLPSVLARDAQAGQAGSARGYFSPSAG